MSSATLHLRDVTISKSYLLLEYSRAGVVMASKIRIMTSFLKLRLPLHIIRKYSASNCSESNYCGADLYVCLDHSLMSGQCGSAAKHLFTIWSQ